MKICIISSSYPVFSNITIGGIASFQRDIAIGLINSNCIINVVAPKQPGSDFNDKNLQIHRFNWYRCNKGLELSSLNPSKFLDLISILSIIIMGFITVYKVHRRYKFDIVFAMWAVPAGFWAFYLKKFIKVPYIVWTLGSDIWDYGRKKTTKWLIKKILKNANKLYSDGFDLAKETSLLGNQPCDFLPSTRNLKKTNPNTTFFKYKDNKKNYLFVGRFHKNKGPDVLIRAISELSKDAKRKSNFYFFGGGDMLQLLVNLKRHFKLDNVYINDFVGPNEIVYLLKNADFLIIPSREDSIPVILSDATQFYLPILATNVGDTGKLVTKYNIGAVVESENPTQLALAIEKTLNKTKKDYFSGLEKINKKFSLKKVLNKLKKDMAKLITPS